MHMYHERRKRWIKSSSKRVRQTMQWIGLSISMKSTWSN